MSRLPRNASAPLRYISWRIALSPEREVTAKTLTAGRLRLIRLVASNPSMRGILISITTMSGCSRRTNATPVSPSSASPITSMSRSNSRQNLVSHRKSASSSIRTTRIGVAASLIAMDAVRRCIGCAIPTDASALCFRVFAVGQSAMSKPSPCNLGRYRGNLAPMSLAGERGKRSAGDLGRLRASFPGRVILTGTLPHVKWVGRGLFLRFPYCMFWQRPC